MKQEQPTTTKKKAPVLILVLCIISFLLTAALVATCLLVFWPNDKTDKLMMTKEEEEYAWQQIDATMIAAVVEATSSDAGGAALKIADDGAYFTAMVGGDIKLTFSLDEAEMWQGKRKGIVDGTDPVTVYASTVIDAGDGVAQAYVEHLEELGVLFDQSTADLDGDGREETYYIVRNALKRYGSLADGMDRASVCMVMDSEGDRTIIHSVCLPNDSDGVKSVVMDNGMIHVTYTAGGKEKLTRYFASDCALGTVDYTADTAALRRLGARYVTYLADQGYRDVSLRLADVSDIEGKELLCCYRDDAEYRTVVMTAKTGRLHTLLVKSGEEGSLFLVNYENNEYLFDYTQELSADYAQRYAYSLFRLNAVCERIVKDAAELTVASHQGGGTQSRAFFDRLQEYLSDSVVCHDPYNLTGTDMMPDVDGETNEETAFLYINNCSTDKTGIVRLQDMDSSWLRLREGPSTSHKIVMFDSANEVKQLHGSLVTVVMPHNTGNAENPIWLEINIRYRNRTLSGYSSQRFIDTSSVRHLMIGERFTVTADTNQTGLTWSSSDPSVASIDAATGLITARNAGMVLITVTTPTGLQDSCLILIDSAN